MPKKTICDGLAINREADRLAHTHIGKRGHQFATPIQQCHAEPPILAPCEFEAQSGGWLRFGGAEDGRQTSRNRVFRLLKTGRPNEEYEQQEDNVDERRHLQLNVAALS